MRWVAVICAGGIVPLAGCNLVYYAGHNLVNEPVSRYDQCKLDARLRAEAEAAWREVCLSYPTRTFTPEFADGFVDGFIDYLDSGGTPQPPAVPPLRYRRSQYLTPDGHARVRDYLTGFKYGAEVACATGRRQFLTVPVVLYEPRPEVPLNIVRVPPPPAEFVGPPLPPDVAPAPVEAVPSFPVPTPRPADLGNPVPPKADPKPAVPPVDAPKLPLGAVSAPGPTVPVVFDLDPNQTAPAVLPPVADRPAALPPVDAPPPPLPVGGQ